MSKNTVVIILIVIAIAVAAAAGALFISNHNAMPLAHVDANSIHIDQQRPTAGPSGLSHD